MEFCKYRAVVKAFWRFWPRLILDHNMVLKQFSKSEIYFMAVFEINSAPGACLLYAPGALLFKYGPGAHLREYCTPNQKLACFVLYLKIINILKNNISYISSCSKLSKELENGIDILVVQTVFKLWIKTIKMLIGSITQEPLVLPKFWCYSG